MPPNAPGAVALQDRVLDAAQGRTDSDEHLMAQLRGLHRVSLLRRGVLGGVLHIRQTEELSAYEALRKKRSTAVPKG